MPALPSSDSQADMAGSEQSTVAVPLTFPPGLTPSTLIPMTLQLQAAKSFCNPATTPSSVVHTGVKSLGREKIIAQPSPIQSWKLIPPFVVSAVKSGAVSLMQSVCDNDVLSRRSTA